MASLITALAVLMPLLALIGLAVQAEASIWGHLVAPIFASQATTTVVLLGCVAILCGLIGTLSAWFVTFYRFPLRRGFAIALLLPLAIPTYLMAYAYGDVLDQAGPLYRLWRAYLPMLQWPDFRSLPGAVILLSLVLYPYVYLSARAAFIQQSAVLIEAGRVLGLSPTACLWRVALPMARPAIIVGMALSMMECLNDIGAVEYLGVNTLTIGVYDTWVVRGNLGGAAQLALGLLGFMALLLWLERSQRGPAAQHTNNGRRRSLPDFQASPGSQIGMALFCAVPVCLGFLVPLFLLLEQAVGSSFGDAVQNAMWRSFGLALGAALLTCLLGLGLSYAARSGPALIKRLGQVAALGYAVPGTVLAIGIMVALGALADASGGIIVISGTAGALLLAYMVRFLSLSFGTLEAGFTRLAPALDMAARSLGARKTGTLWRVHLPLLRPSLLTAAILVFVDVMKELPATLILRPFDFETLATSVYMYASVGQLEDAALPALLIIAVGLIPVAISLKLLDNMRQSRRAAR